ncbi:SAM-dependent methyltransferase [Bailinhaonella thermotolerans]|uniref:SAM-dependent methyltransferase n=1 Tax=Bailinhaonella thermotolerans TaxID=1070861 RepID=A0A3A4B620_9ACTN|nr:SAM-dependent methyltransferase [Bailinhaonella thermotolerans]RJL32852.1 SAM-dependent methyltransferase [Bailinhaonella thermotolerans]
MTELNAAREAAPSGVDVNTPSIARVYDFFLDGKDNYASDREVAQALLDIVPEAAIVARANRAVLRRAVRYLVGEAGIRQFLDIGSGLPTAGNVHEIAHEIDPDTRVVYVDNDPIVLVHGRALLADNKTTVVVQADARRPREILEHEATREMLDLDRPVAVLLAGLLHHIEDQDDPKGIAAELRDAVPSGSHLLITHFCDPGDDPLTDPMRAALRAKMSGFVDRRREVIAEFFEGLEMVSPGLVHLHEWRPDAEAQEQDHPLQRFMVAGLARKP